jgi:hypothetical protein
MQRDYSTPILSFYYESRRTEEIPSSVKLTFSNVLLVAGDFASDERIQTEDVLYVLRGLCYAQLRQQIA